MQVGLLVTGLAGALASGIGPAGVDRVVVEAAGVVVVNSSGSGFIIMGVLLFEFTGGGVRTAWLRLGVAG